MDKNNIWYQIAEYARFAPSPHNTQPSRLKIINEHAAELYYDLSRALPEGDPPARFALTAIGLFVEACKIAAASYGYQLNTTYLEGVLHNKQGSGLQKVADLVITPQKGIVDLPADLILKRRTNRLPYNNKKLDKLAVEEIQQEVRKFGHDFIVTDSPTTVQWVTDLNRRMVFYDLDEKNVRDELAVWSRFTKRSAHRYQDGLSAECLNVPGWGLWIFMKHYGLLKIPGIGQLLRWIYKRNMHGISSVGWLQGPFHTQSDYLKSGHVLLRAWLLMTKHGIAYHPFGSVITNEKAHKEFADFLKIDESKSMAWLLMRLGYSDMEPPQSERLPIEEILL